MNEEIKEILKGMKKANNEDCNLWLENESVKLLYNYITNLQKRKITKEDVEKYFEENMCVSFDKFIENWEEQEEFTKYLQNENEELKERIVKAIEYIEDNTYEAYETEYMDLTGIKELKNILGGDE